MEREIIHILSLKWVLDCITALFDDIVCDSLIAHESFTETWFSGPSRVKTVGPEFSRSLASIFNIISADRDGRTCPNRVEALIEICSRNKFLKMRTITRDISEEVTIFGRRVAGRKCHEE